MRKYNRKNKYNIYYAGKYTKRTIARKRMGVKICVAVFLLMVCAQAMAMTNDILIESVIEPLVEEVEPQEFKESAVIRDSYNVPNGINEAYDHIVDVTSAKGLDTELYLAIINCESGFNPDARNSISSARGLCQFTEGTFLDGIRWRGLDWTLKDRFDYKKSLDMMIYFVEERGEIRRWECLNLI